MIGNITAFDVKVLSLSHVSYFPISVKKLEVKLTLPENDVMQSAGLGDVGGYVDDGTKQ